MPNAVSDAREVSALLRDLGWNVDLLENPDGKTLSSKLTDLIVGPDKDRERAVLVWFAAVFYELFFDVENALSFSINIKFQS